MADEQRCGLCRHLDRAGNCDAPVSSFIEDALPMCYERRPMWSADRADNCPCFERKEAGDAARTD